jgi:hypothetical protein
MFRPMQPVSSPLDVGAPDSQLPGKSYADTVERLFDEYAGVLGLSTIANTVASCRRDLAGSPDGAQAELIERLARVRLQQAILPAA